MSKPPFNFKPAPRPARDPDLARRMAEESADLGFSRTTSAPKVEPADQSSEGPTAPLPESANEPSPDSAIGHLPQQAIEQPAEEPTAPEPERATAPSGKGLVARSSERPKARRANVPSGQGRNAVIARANDGTTAQLAKGHFGDIAGTVKLDVSDPLWTELRMAAARRRVSIRYLVHEALEAYGYTVDLSLIPEDGRRLR